MGSRPGNQNNFMSTISGWAGYRVLIVGCGSIGRRHARNLKSLGVRQLGFCDTSPKALQQCREELNGEVFGDYDEALPKFKPDIVLICTPPVYHVEEALAALRAQAHVFIEKPLSHESSGIQALIAEARRCGSTRRRGSTFPTGVPGSTIAKATARVTNWAGASFSTALTNWITFAGCWGGPRK